MNLKVIHYVMLGLVAVVVAASALASVFPQYANALHAAIGTSVSILGALALVSPSAAQGVPLPAVAQLGELVATAPAAPVIVNVHPAPAPAPAPPPDGAPAAGPSTGPAPVVPGVTDH